MSNPIIRIHNIETDEIIDREMTDDEFADYEEKAAAEAMRKSAIESAKSAAEAKLAALGLTADDLKALGL